MPVGLWRRFRLPLPDAPAYNLPLSQAPCFCAPGIPEVGTLIALQVTENAPKS
jgi:hypothetical protein